MNKAVLREGSITPYRLFGKNTDTNGIILQGRTGESFLGTWFILGNSITNYAWSGSFTASGIKQSLTITSVANNSPFPGINSVTIKKMPEIWKFEKFNISDTGSFGDDQIPARLTGFSLDNKNYSVMVTVADKIDGVKLVHSMYMLMNRPDQIFQIVDESGTVYAEFTKDSYRLFDVVNQDDIGRMQSAVAIYSIVHRMCTEIDRAVSMNE